MSSNIDKRPNVQFFILHRNGKKQIIWRYCRCWSEANNLARNLKTIHNAQRVWF